MRYTESMQNNFCLPYRREHNPLELPIHGDAGLIYKLRPELKANQDAVMSQELAGGSGEPFTFVRAEGHRTPNARLPLHGRIAPTGIHGGASPAEMGEGRGQPPTPLPDPRNKQPSESSDSESNEEGVPKRGISAPPPSGMLNNAVIGQKIDIGWNEDRLLYHRFGHLHIMGSGPESKCPMIIESDGCLGQTPYHLEIISPSSMPDAVFDRTFDVSSSVDIVKQPTQSVEQLSLRMDSSGWVLVVDFTSKLGVSTQSF